MPIYSFTCESCKFSRDLLLKSYKDIPDQVFCSECQAQMYRNFTVEKPAFHLVGGCWGSQGYEMSDTEALRRGRDDD